MKAEGPLKPPYECKVVCESEGHRWVVEGEDVDKEDNLKTTPLEEEG